MRVLGVCRISKDTEASTAIVRQRKAIELWAEGNGHEVVAWALDEDVSGTVAPWDRAGLGAWLNHPDKPQPEAFHDWDVLAVWRLDRLSRRVVPLMQTLDLLAASGKTAVSTSEGFDPATPMGRVFVTILAALAEGELEAIKERNRNTAHHLITTGGDRGSTTPYGFVRDGKRGLMHDPAMVADLGRIVDRIVDGHSINGVMLWANAEGILTPKDAYWRSLGKFPRVKDGSTQEPYRWTVRTLKRTLSSRTLLGEAVMRDKSGESVTVLRSDGSPIVKGSPLMSASRFNALQDALNGRTRIPKKRFGRAPMLGVGFCQCGSRLHIRRTRDWHYYQCADAAKSGLSCPESVKPIRVDAFHAVVRERFLSLFGDLPVTRRVYVPGEDHTEELATVVERLSALDRAFTNGAYDGPTGERDYVGIRRALSARRATLDALPNVPSSWRDEATGETWAQRMDGLDDLAMGDALRDAGIAAVLRPASDGFSERVSVEWTQTTVMPSA